MYQRTYYEKNRYEICKKRLGIYWENAMRRARMRNKKIVELMYRLYPYEKYAEVCFKRIVRKYHIYRNSYLYDECHSVSSQAYMYTMSMLSYQTHTEESVKKYLYTMIRIYIICVLNTSNEVKKICTHNKLRVINVNDYRI